MMGWLLAALFSVGSLILALACLYFAQRMRGFYRSARLAQLFPQGVMKFDKMGAVNRPFFIFLGDSRSAAWPSPQIAGARWLNHGVPGETSVQTVLRLEQDVLRWQPSAVILQIGVNDLASIPAAPEIHDVIVAQLKANLTEIAQQLKSADIPLILTTIFAQGSPTIRDRFILNHVPAIDEINAHIRTLAADGVIIFETDEILTEGDGMVKRPFQIDLLHINSQAYAALNKALIPRLSSLTIDN